MQKAGKRKSDKPKKEVKFLLKKIKEVLFVILLFRDIKNEYLITKFVVLMGVAGKKWKFPEFSSEIVVEDSELSATSSKYYTQDKIKKHI